MKSRTSTSRVFVRSLVSAVAAAGLFAHAGVAEAKPKLAGELDAVIPLLPDTYQMSVGAGGAIRFGYEIRLPLVAIMPEVSLGMYKIGDDGGPRIIRGLAGGRIGFGEVFRPGVYAHVGFGHEHVGSISYNHLGAAFDAGAFVDFTLLPIFDIGVHGGYNVVTPDSTNLGGAIGFSRDATKWINAGIHASLAF